MRGEDFEALAVDLEVAVGEALAPLERDPGLWTRGLPGKWTAGQHLEHVALVLRATAEALEQRMAALREGTLPHRPRRGPLQALFVAAVVARGRLPRGGKTAPAFAAPAQPDPAELGERLRRDVERHRRLGESLSAAQRDALWIPNPFRPQWHYTLPETLRMQAVHVRHHAQSTMTTPRSEGGHR
jgi:hypothetical protein